MLIVSETLLAVIIEIIMFTLIPIIIRLVKKEPLKGKTAWRITIINHALVLSIANILTSKLLNMNIDLMHQDLFSLLLLPINVSILKHESGKDFAETLTNNYKKVLKMVAICFITLLIISLICFFIWKNMHNNVYNNFDNDNNIIDNEVGFKEINNEIEFKKIISSKDNSVILFIHDRCAYCALASPVVELIAKDYEMNNMYYYNIDNGNLDFGFDLEGTPTLAIYKNNKFIANKNGYTMETKSSNIAYRNEVIEFLQDNNVIN